MHFYFSGETWSSWHGTGWQENSCRFFHHKESTHTNPWSVPGTSYIVSLSKGLDHSIIIYFESACKCWRFCRKVHLKTPKGVILTFKMLPKYEKQNVLGIDIISYGFKFRWKILFQFDTFLFQFDTSIGTKNLSHNRLSILGMIPTFPS